METGPKENRNVKLALMGCIGAIVLAIVLIAVYVLIGPESSGMVSMVLSIGAMLLILASGLLYLVAFALLGWEIATAKNDFSWKATWIGIMLVSLIFSGAPGMILYWIVGRKALKD